ncbi:MAG: FtsX-like permease family protein [Roseiflexaceae bacterium]
MRSPRWQKLLRDLWLTRGRTALMVIAIAVSLFGVGTVLSAYAILTPEISRNYLGTNPASATLELDRVDDALLAVVKARPGIAAAEARETLIARVQVAPDQWRPLLLFVVPDFNAMQISTFTREEGAWPPPDGTMLLERTALPMLNAQLGDRVVVKTPHGAAQAVAISGVVHDPSLAPAWQEREGYAYITPATLARLGESGPLGELKIVVAGSPFDQATVDRTTRDLGVWLQQQGRTVRELQIPPAGQHPHQGQMTSMLTMLLSFSLLALLLSAILVATVVAGLLAQQIREIGAMKTIGARTRQIAGMYVGLILLMSGVALALAVGPSIVVGRLYAGGVADLLNFTIVNDTIPAWVFAVEVAAGLLIPLLVAAYPIMRASRITVYAAITDYGVSTAAVDGNGIIARLSALHRLNSTLLLALRNTFRRRGRLLLTLGLLSVGGAMFMTGLNIRDGWDRIVADGVAARHYTMEIRLSRQEPIAPLIARLRAIPGVQTVEPWGYAPTGPTRPGVIDVVRTYPDGGHGAFALRAPPADTRLVDFPLLAGRWLQPGDSDAVVLNQLALRQLPGVGVGDSVTLGLEGQPTTWRVVGIVQEIGLGAGAYVTDAAFARAGDLVGRARSLRIVTATQDDAATAAVLRTVERSLQESGVGVATTLSDVDLRSGLDDHVLLLIVSLVVTSVLMAIVGVLGLTSTMSTNVVERTREFGVMQTIGGTPRLVRSMVVSEGLFIGALSWVFAIVLALPLSTVVNGMVGRPLFNVALPLVSTPLTMLIWLAVVLVGSALASAVPAWRASRLTVRETLAYV